MAKLEAFIKAKEKLSKVLLETHLIYSPIFSKESGNKVFSQRTYKKQVHLR